jgi:hypothetical protein
LPDDFRRDSGRIFENLLLGFDKESFAAISLLEITEESDRDRDDSAFDIDDDSAFDVDDDPHVAARDLGRSISWLTFSQPALSSPISLPCGLNLDKKPFF